MMVSQQMDRPNTFDSVRAGGGRTRFLLNFATVDILDWYACANCTLAALEQCPWSK